MRWTLVAMVLALAGCLETGGGSCPEPKEYQFFESGSYSSPGGAPSDYYCNDNCGAVFSPHEGVTDLKLELNVEQNAAIIRYMRDGKEIVEKWKVTSRASF